MRDKIREAVRLAMPNKNLKLTDDVDMIDDLGFDSIAMIALISGLEEKCGVSFDDDELDLRNFRNITTIVNTVEKCHEKN
jgi:acyl carrier protein